MQANFVTDGKPHVVHWVVYATVGTQAEASRIGHSAELTFTSAGPPTERAAPSALTYTSTSVGLCLMTSTAYACCSVQTSSVPASSGICQKIKERRTGLTAVSGSAHRSTL